MLRDMTMPLSDPAAAAAGPLFIVLNAGSGHRDAGSTQQTIAGLLDEAGRAHEFLLI
ncbi:UNVERIFIED_CONTAM: diacylglycerol kinase, partial [Salmonella enterica subsp. enterica serovar Weltevreden]